MQKLLFVGGVANGRTRGVEENHDYAAIHKPDPTIFTDSMSEKFSTTDSLYTRRKLFSRSDRYGESVKIEFMAEESLTDPDALRMLLDGYATLGRITDYAPGVVDRCRT